MAECIMLVATETSEANRTVIETTKAVLAKWKVKYSIEDGSQNTELRNQLFEVSEQSGVYPQMFIKDGDAYTFVATGEEVQQMNEMADTIKEMLKEDDKFLESRPEIKHLPLVFKDFIR
eukprot:TRINITY_DN3202_c0_g1_i1.p1 TRINITY_DN3202_c0_g1~~TRINITY_DN3202_c0_g1_i1.p1  ORF type:complete len:138 (-),score=32.28 TRINITY_DN3202_c0_g1_i1:94-450(-)